jgi:hypothetical protein
MIGFSRRKAGIGSNLGRGAKQIQAWSDKDHAIIAAVTNAVTLNENDKTMLAQQLRAEVQQH